MILYPAIDVRGGRCVRLVQGDFDRLTSYGDPVDVARDWEAAGAEWIHMVDLDAAAGEGENGATVTAVTRNVGVPVQLGGGLRDITAVERALERGVSRVILGTAAVE